MGSADRKQLILDYYAATIDGDLDRIAQAFTDDVRIWMPRSAAKRGLPIPLVGRDNFLDLSRRLIAEGSEFWRPTKWAPHVFLIEGDKVAVHVTHEGVMPDGRVYNNDYMFLYTFAGDQICELREFVDTAWINDFLAAPSSAAV
jgi:ketosteroid isomerase-like protein